MTHFMHRGTLSCFYFDGSRLTQSADEPPAHCFSARLCVWSNTTDGVQLWLVHFSSMVPDLIRNHYLNRKITINSKDLVTLLILLTYFCLEEVVQVVLMWSCMRYLSLVSIFPVGADHWLPLCGDAAHSTGREVGHCTGKLTARCI